LVVRSYLKELLKVENSRLTYAEIDLSAVVHNYRLLCDEAGADVTLLAVVKANAYGHGAIAVSRALADAGAPMFAVASIEEAAALRHAGIEQPILVMGIVLPGQEELLLQYGRYLLIASSRPGSLPARWSRTRPGRCSSSSTPSVNGSSGRIMRWP
jgi:alanine racemase